MKLVKFQSHFISLRVLFLLAILSLSYSSCKNDSVAELPNPEDQEILNYLAEQGYDLEEVKILEDFVDYEEDAGWDKEGLLQMIRGENQDPIPLDPELESLADYRQRGIRDANRTDAITRGRVDDIEYFIRPSVQNHLGTFWVNGINNAANNWNDMSTCRVNFIRTFSESGADIVIGSRPGYRNACFPPKPAF